jgi:hypothetical protein
MDLDVAVDERPAVCDVRGAEVYARDVGSPRRDRVQQMLYDGRTVRADPTPGPRADAAAD